MRSNLRVFEVNIHHAAIHFLSASVPRIFLALLVLACSGARCSTWLFCLDRERVGDGGVSATPFSEARRHGGRGDPRLYGRGDLNAAAARAQRRMGSRGSPLGLPCSRSESGRRTESGALRQSLHKRRFAPLIAFGRRSCGSLLPWLHFFRVGSIFSSLGCMKDAQPFFFAVTTNNGKN